MMSNTKVMPFHYKIYCLVYVLSCNLIAADSKEFEKTVGMLNKTFRGYVISREVTKDPSISILDYHQSQFDLESYSKRELLGVRFLVKDTGEIVAVAPLAFKLTLPSQEAVNSEINLSIRASEFFSKHRFVECNDIQAYGLMSRWAIATLARKEDVAPNLNLLDEQKAVVARIFKGALVIPTTDPSDQSTAIKKIENFAKEVIQYVEK
jgi:hypothetical protein